MTTAPEKKPRTSDDTFPQKSAQELSALKAKLKDAYLEANQKNDTSEKKSEEEKHKIRWITRAMADDFDREQVLFSSLIETIIYLIFLAVTSVHVLNLKSSQMYYMTKALKGQLLEREFNTINDVGITFDDVKSVADMWKYIQSNFFDSIYSDSFYTENESNTSKRCILYDNVMLGVPRLRQVRVKADSCEIHPYFKRLFRSCYASFSKSAEDQQAFGRGEGTAWNFNDEKKTLNLAYDGRVAKYTGGGYYVDLFVDAEMTKKLLEQLEYELWVTRNTRAIFIDFTVYNVNLNTFGICKIVFEIPPTGGVLPSSKFNCLKLIPVVDDWDYLTSICAFLFYIFILFYVAQSLRELAYFKWKYFALFWSYVDATITGLAVTTFLLERMKSSRLEDDINKVKDDENRYGNLEKLADLQLNHNDISAILSFLVYVRLFKYLNFNKTMGQLNDTLKNCSMDILGFSLMFFIIFFAYAELGYLLFGNQVEDFRTFGVAMFTLLRTILGDFDYETIEHANRVLAPLYFLTYIFFVFFVLLNMFLAIINDTYADVKTEIAIAPPELQMVDLIKRYFGKLFALCGLRPKFHQIRKDDGGATAEEIRAVLRKCGFSHLEIEMFFARYKIDPLAVVNEGDVNKLMAALDDRANSADETKVVFDRSFDDDLREQRRQLEVMEGAVLKLGARVDELIGHLKKLALRSKIDIRRSDSDDFWFK